MEFDSNTPIYLQIADSFCDRVLAGELKAEDRIPSVREWGAEIGVNPNTVARAYEELTDRGVIYQKRGLGFYIAETAADTIMEAARKEFIEQELPRFARRAQLLQLDLLDLLKII